MEKWYGKFFIFRPSGLSLGAWSYATPSETTFSSDSSNEYKMVLLSYREFEREYHRIPMLLTQIYVKLKS